MGMKPHAIVRVSFQSNVQANQGTNRALVGHAQDASGSGPFDRSGTGCYITSGQSKAGDVLIAIRDAVEAAIQNLSDLDYLSVTVTLDRASRAA